MRIAVKRDIFVSFKMEITETVGYDVLLKMCIPKIFELLMRIQVRTAALDNDEQHSEM